MSGNFCHEFPFEIQKMFFVSFLIFEDDPDLMLTTGSSMLTLGYISVIQAFG